MLTKDYGIKFQISQQLFLQYDYGTLRLVLCSLIAKAVVLHSDHLFLEID